MNQRIYRIATIGIFSLLGVIANAQENLKPEMDCQLALKGTVASDKSISIDEWVQTDPHSLQQRDLRILLLEAKRNGKNGFYELTDADTVFLPFPALNPIIRNEMGGVYSYNYFEVPLVGRSQSSWITYSVPQDGEDPAIAMGDKPASAVPRSEYKKLSQEAVGHVEALRIFRDNLLESINSISNKRKREFEMLGLHWGYGSPQTIKMEQAYIQKTESALQTCSKVADSTLHQSIAVQQKLITSNSEAMAKLHRQLQNVEPQLRESIKGTLKELGVDVPKK